MSNYQNRFSKYIVSTSSSILNVLQSIDNNNKRFAIVLKGERVVGIVTDGDIRRLILFGSNLSDKISFSTNFHFVDYKDNFATICEKFREHSIDFLPILKSGKLFEVLTKQQFHSMLLEDVDYKSDMDFSTFDKVKIEHEIYNRPWGYYKSVLLSSHAQAKIITIFPDSEISLQKHFHREEHWIIIKGKGKVVCGDKNFVVLPGEYIHIPKETKHQVENILSNENLLLSEVQLGDYFGEDDIIRYSDKYGRS